MKYTKLTLTFILVFLGFMSFANFPFRDTIKIMAGGKQIVIISNTKDDQKKALENGILEFNNKIEHTQYLIDSLNNVVDSLQNKLDTTSNDTLKTEIENIKNQIKNDYKLINALKKGIEDINNELKNLEKDTLGLNPHKKKLSKLRTKYKHKFEAHWGGVEFGLNSFILDQTKIINNTSSVLAPKLGSSYNLNINMLESEFGITSFWGIVTGLGIQFHNFDYNDFPYYSENNYLLQLDSLHSAYDKFGKIRHIKLKYVNIVLPLLTEIQFNKSGNIFVNLGGYIALRTFAKLKFIYTVDNRRTVLKSEISQMISPFEYGFSIRIGIKKIQFYSQYSLVPLFKNPDNPYLNPISLGIRLSF